MTGNEITDKITLDYIESQIGGAQLLAEPNEITNYILVEILKQMIELNNKIEK